AATITFTNQEAGNLTPTHPEQATITPYGTLTPAPKNINNKTTNPPTAGAG
ncbi:MAG: hypothetical protein JWP10_1622, partial [Nocardioidaceae bacterium]|nr:hypothetical protein [Nocardioidaceae bacterium]